MHASLNGDTSILAHDALCFEESLEEDWKCEHLNVHAPCFLLVIQDVSSLSAFAPASLLAASTPPSRTFWSCKSKQTSFHWCLFRAMKFEYKLAVAYPSCTTHTAPTRDSKISLCKHAACY